MALFDYYTVTRLSIDEDFPTREKAFASEQRIKGWSRKEKSTDRKRLGRSIEISSAKTPFESLRVIGEYLHRSYC